MRTSPCMDYCSRCLGCHDICPAFKNYNEKKAMRNPEEAEFSSYLISAIRRMKGERA